jgi:hypothetical protein
MIIAQIRYVVPLAATRWRLDGSTRGTSTILVHHIGLTHIDDNDDTLYAVEMDTQLGRERGERT